jgi:hypothetical protein
VQKPKLIVTLKRSDLSHLYVAGYELAFLCFWPPLCAVPFSLYWRGFFKLLVGTVHLTWILRMQVTSSSAGRSPWLQDKKRRTALTVNRIYWGTIKQTRLHGATNRVTWAMLDSGMRCVCGYWCGQRATCGLSGALPSWDPSFIVTLAAHILQPRNVPEPRT